MRSIDLFLSKGKALEMAEKFLLERSIPDVAGHSECLANLLTECFREGAQFVSAYIQDELEQVEIETMLENKNG